MGEQGVYRRIRRLLKVRTNQAGNLNRTSLPLKYKLPFYGQMYRAWSRFIHKHGYHYAPKQYPPEPHTPRTGLGGQPITEWYHWCQWCGLRGSTIDVTAQRLSQRLNQTVSDNGHARTLQDYPSKTNDGGSDGGL